MNRLEWDSEFFGVEVATAAGEDPSAALAAARAAGVDCLYVFVPGDDLATVEGLMRRGARLVDLRVVLEWEGEAAAAAGVSRAVSLDRVRAWAHGLAPQSRFARDPRFGLAQAERLYDRWLDRCAGEGIVVVHEDGDGFVGARSLDGVAHVDLVYVAPESSGRGIGRAPVAGALAELGATRARVVTQLGNVAALRLYESLGFRAAAVHTILHAWPDEMHP